VPSPPPEAATAPPFMSFTRDQWATLRAATPLLLGEAELRQLRGLNEPISVEEVTDVFLPLSRLVNLYVTAARALLQVTDTFLGRPSLSPPFVLAIAGSVAAGKSTIARVLRALLARWPDHPHVELVTTDGFLYPNAVLDARGLMRRKGFPESYDVGRLLRFLADVKAGRPEVEAPVYSHLTYDVVPGEHVIVRRPDILIVEGINVLQAPGATGPRDDGAAGDGATGDGASRPRVVVSDFFDFSIYVDAEEPSLRRWYVERFLKLRDTAFRRPESYFHRYASLSAEEAVETAVRIWEEINYVNLMQNIEGTRDRATLVLRKGPAHLVEEVRLRRAPLAPATARAAR
jgi:type I pantothenate kinase